MSRSKSVAQHAKAVGKIGHELQSILQQEGEDSKQRARTLHMLQFALDDENNSDSIINRILKETKASLHQLVKKSKLAIARENGLQDKISKKEIDIQRNLKLLASLNVGVQPAHHVELERAEEELQEEYENYVVRLRNIDYLEGELRVYQKNLLEKREQSARSFKRMQETFRKEAEAAKQQQREDDFCNAHPPSPSSKQSSLCEDTEHSRSDESESLSAEPSSDESSASDESNSLGDSNEDYDSDDDNNF